MNQDQLYIHRCNELALLGMGKVAPNPMVGALLVYNNVIVAEGYHAYYGGPHAEVMAINNLKDKSILSNCTLYVNLEPCNYHGKTPPCTNLILKHGIKKVVIGSIDPNPLVAGKGLEFLIEQGIAITQGILEQECNYLNRRFFKHILFQKPYVCLKYAKTQDGFLAQINYDSKWISNTLSRTYTHKLRGEYEAILIGYNTAFHDNPTLDTRLFMGKNPIVVLLDKYLKIPIKSHIFTKNKATKIIFNTIKTEETDDIKYIKTNFDTPEFISNILNELYNHQILSVMVEGGAKTLAQFVAAREWDEAYEFIGDKYFYDGLLAPNLKTKASKSFTLLNDVVNYYQKQS